MNRNMLWVFIMVVMLFASAHSVQAALINNGNGTITDDDLGIMWLQSPGPDADFADAVTWADNLVFAGYDNWRLPSALNFDTGLPDEAWWSVDNEFGHLYGIELGNPTGPADIAPLVGYGAGWYWTGTMDPNNPADAYAFYWSYDGLWFNESTADNVMSTATIMGVTAVRDINGTKVPEPVTVLLLGAGLMGVGMARRFIR